MMRILDVKSLKPHCLLKVNTSSSGQFNRNYFNVMNHDHGLSLYFIKINVY